ncbi:oxoglutarate/iron-dependent dioxygenase [Tanacetum coccineum]
MCFGRNWDPKIKYNKHYRSDGSEAPPAPPILGKLISLVERSLHCQVYENSRDEFPSIHPDICVAKFFTTTSRLGIFQEDGHHSDDSVRRRLPLVSFFIGDSAEILHSSYYGSYEPDKVLLESGDVLIYNGYNKYLYYGVKRIIPESAPLPLLNETMLRPGCLNLNLKQDLLFSNESISKSQKMVLILALQSLGLMCPFLLVEFSERHVEPIERLLTVVIPLPLLQLHAFVEPQH